MKKTHGTEGERQRRVVTRPTALNKRRGITKNVYDREKKKPPDLKGKTEGEKNAKSLLHVRESNVETTNPFSLERVGHQKRNEGWARARLGQKKFGSRRKMRKGGDQATKVARAVRKS